MHASTVALLRFIDHWLAKRLSATQGAPIIGGNALMLKAAAAFARLLLLSLVLMVLLALGGCGAVYYRFGRDVPSHDDVINYDPATITRVYASDGALMAEYAQERRLFVPLEAIPLHVQHAFLSAEDKDFYDHGGVDYVSFASAMVRNVPRVLQGRRPAGASTITQQVAKNFITGDDFSVSRKVREAFVAWRLEADLDKNRILELYLNEIYFGVRSYGIAQAALTYFDKGVGQLTVAEGAYLAAVINGPNILHPTRHKQRALTRRNWVLGQMLKNQFIDQAEYDQAMATDLVATLSPRRSIIDNAGYFSAEVRRRLVRNFGENAVLTDGLNVRSTMQQDLQNLAKDVLQEGLIAYDRRHGWRGAIANERPNDANETWVDVLNRSEAAAQAALEVPQDWRLSIVTDVQDDQVALQFDDGASGTMPFDQLRWAAPNMPDQTVGPAPTVAGQVLNVGDIIAVSRVDKTGNDAQADIASDRAKAAANAVDTVWALEQLPDVEGGLVAMDPHTGRVLALVGGFDFEKSNFNRASQAYRQPGSVFKPFVYLTGINAGYSPTTPILDNPWVVKQPDDTVWRPINYDERFLGAQPMHVGLEWSRNLMTVRLANAVGMDRVVDTATAFGVGENVGEYLSASIGSDETTLLDMTTAYAILANGGRRIYPSLIDRVQDKNGQTIFKHDERLCVHCTSESLTLNALPSAYEPAQRVASSYSVYQLTSMLRGVVERGTAQSVNRIMDGRPVAGKTGTTNQARDAWFVGYTPDLVVGVYVGFDTPKPLGKGEGGGKAASPIFANFMARALEGTEVIPFRLPPDVPAEYIDPVTGTIDVTQMTNDGRQISGESEDQLDPQLKQQELQANDALADDNRDDADDNGNIGAIY